VLVGNKIDLRGQDITNQNLEDEIIPIMNEFKVMKNDSTALQSLYFVLTILCRKLKLV
jgi:hypothetical protein